MIIKLTSNTKNFSWILNKNPESCKHQPFEKKVAKGIAYSWFENENTFKIFFKDEDNQVSFINDNSFDFLDKTRYYSPYGLLTLIKLHLSSAMRELKDDNTNAEIEFLVKNTSKFVLNAFYNELNTRKDINFGFIQSINNDRLIIVKINADSINKVLNMASLFLFIMYLSDHEYYIQPNHDFAVKYINLVNTLNLSYYIKHILVTKLILNQKSFDNLKNIINTNGVNIKYGLNQDKRFNFIKYNLQEHTNKIIDIGCGEGFYIKRLSSYAKEYIAFDGNEDVIFKVKKLVDNKKLNNVVIYDNYITKDYVNNNKSLFEDATVILTEVIEHIKYNDSIDIINALLNANIDKLLITTPNSSFNKHYYLDNKFRHDDHFFELNENDLIVYLSKLDTKNYNVETYNIGDEVHNVPSTFGITLTKKV